MNARLQSTLLLVATLAVGVVMGAAGSEQVARLWRPRAPIPAGLPSPRGVRLGGGAGGFVTKMEDAIAPRDDAQRQAVRRILEETSARNRREIEAVNASLKARVDSTREALAPLLDAEQAERLAEAMRSLQPIGPRGRGEGMGPAGQGPAGRRGGPPPIGGPPPR